MTPNELDELRGDCPHLFHMAERGAWEGIERHGLLSTSALLDLYHIAGTERQTIERQHRPKIVVISNAEIGTAAIRDQIPMTDGGLLRALPAQISPSDWYFRLNQMVFFWLTEERLHRLTSAKAYREVEHEILVFDTKALLDAYSDRIWLCPINSGCTKPMPHPRDFETFARIADYDYVRWASRRRRGERVVELCVDDGIPDAKDFVVDKYIILGSERLAGL